MLGECRDDMHPSKLGRQTVGHRIQTKAVNECSKLEDGNLTTTIGMRTQLLEYAEEDLKELGEGEEVK